MQKQRIHKLLSAFNKVQKEAQLPPWQKTTNQEPSSSSSTSTALVPTSSTVQQVNHIDNTTIQGVFAVTNIFSMSANIPKEANPAIYNKFILNSGATVHICNDHSQFINMQDDKQWLTHGDSRTWISSCSIVRLWMITPDSQD